MRWSSRPQTVLHNAVLSSQTINTVQSYRSSVAKSSVERLIVWIEKVLYVCETLHLKLLWLLLNDFPTQKNMTHPLHTHWGKKSDFSAFRVLYSY